MESSNLLLLEIIRCFLSAALDQFSLDAGSMTTSMECFGISRKTGCWPCPSVTSETLKITGKCTTSNFVRIHTHRNALLKKEQRLPIIYLCGNPLPWWNSFESKYNGMVEDIIIAKSQTTPTSCLFNFPLQFRVRAT